MEVALRMAREGKERESPGLSMSRKDRPSSSLQVEAERPRATPPMRRWVARGSLGMVETPKRSMTPMRQAEAGAEAIVGSASMGRLWSMRAVAAVGEVARRAAHPSSAVLAVRPGETRRGVERMDRPTVLVLRAVTVAAARHRGPQRPARE